MKTLPKYFIIKKDINNPLWDKYIDWLNKTYNEDWAGTMIYYGVDGSTKHNGCDGWYKIEKFKNNPTLITLEQWDEAVNGFVLPEIWWVEVTEENKDVLSKWRGVSLFVGQLTGMCMDYATGRISREQNPLHLSKENRYSFGNKITYEQFLKYVLKQDAMEKDFELPKRWAVRVTDENKNILTKWVKSHDDFVKDAFLPIRNYVVNFHPDKSYQTYARDLKITEYTEITYDQFKKYVLGSDRDIDKIIDEELNKAVSNYPVTSKEYFNESNNINLTNATMKEIIGYRLIKPEYEEVTYQIGDKGIVSINDNGTQFYYQIKGYLPLAADKSIRNLKEAGVLDLWFEPVYEQEYKAGDVVVVKSHRQCKEGNGIDQDDTIAELRPKGSSREASGMLDYETDFIAVFLYNGNLHYRNIRKSHIIRLATDKEKEGFKNQALIDEAKRRYPKGTNYIPTARGSNYPDISSGNFVWCDDRIEDAYNHTGIYDLSRNKWAEIIKELVKPNVTIRNWNVICSTDSVKVGCESFTIDEMKVVKRLLKRDMIVAEEVDAISQILNYYKI